MRGRKPKPIARQLAEGDPRKIGKQKLLERSLSEPSTTPGLPECPRHLRGRARAAWNFWMPELSLMDIDRKPDSMMLEGACVAYEKAVQADLMLAKDGLVVEESIIDKESGEKIVLKYKAHPANTLSQRNWTLVRVFCSEFGLSPVSRMRLAHDKPDSKMPDLADILAGPREKRAAVN